MSAFLMELIAVNKSIQGNWMFLWQGPYVAAFASSNLGDVSRSWPALYQHGESCENAQ